jgi:hypothetical protein
MLYKQDQVLSLYSSCNYESDIANKLLDIKNEELVKVGSYIHAGCLYACEMIDSVFKELIDLIDELKKINKESITTVEEHFTKNLDRYESLAAALGIECTIHVVDLHANGWVFIKKVQFDTSSVSDDISRLWSLL